MRASMRDRRGLVAGLGLLAMLALAPTALAADAAIDISGFAFPATTTISVGDSVTWSNTSGVPHTATADDASFDTGNIADGASDAVTFTTAGSFAYHCSIHAAMTGTIVVQAAGGATAPATDVLPTTAAAADGDGHDSTAAILALLGLVMLAATAIANRRFAEARVRVRSRDDEG